MTLRLIQTILCGVMIIAPSYAQTAISTKLDLDYVSKYVWRGQVLNPDPVLQPSLTFTHNNSLSFNLWSSLDATDVNTEQGQATEIDYTLNYAWSAGGKCLNAGLIDYVFPHTQFNSTAEAYSSVCFGGPFSPSLAVNYDFDEGHGYYASFTTGYTCTMPWQKGMPSTLNLSARVSYATAGCNELYFATDKAAFTDLLLSASAPIVTKGRLSITPSLSYSTLIDHSLRQAVKSPDNFIAGLTASLAF